MYSYIKGRLTELEADALVVEANGVGYRIYTAGQTFGYLPPVGEEIKVYTYLHIREDAMLLYGFLTKDDLRVFQLLLGISGIGPKGALSVLSVMTTDDLRFAVLADDAKAIAKAPGVGAKTAQRIILELRDKLSLADAFGGAGGQQPRKEAGGKADDAKNEALQALTALGYSSSEAWKALSGLAVTEESDAEELLKMALKQMALI